MTFLESAGARAERRLRWPLLFLRIFDAHVLGITALALLATWLALRWGLAATLPGEIIAVAIVFPIVFSIQASYKRREDALRLLGQLRSSLAAVWLAHRDLPPEGGAEHAARAERAVRAMDAAVRDVLLAGRSATLEDRARVGEAASDLSRSIQRLRGAGVPHPEVSRVNGLLAAALSQWENLRTIVQYRTPLSLRAHSKMFLNVFPILYAPAYAKIAADGDVWLGYAVAAAVAVVLAGLDNIQDGLEHPFDAQGSDDVGLTAGGLVLPADGLAAAPTARADARTP